MEINCKGKGYHTWSYCKESNTLRNYILLCAWWYSDGKATGINQYSINYQ